MHTCLQIPLKTAGAWVGEVMSAGPVGRKGGVAKALGWSRDRCQLSRSQTAIRNIWDVFEGLFADSTYRRVNKYVLAGHLNHRGYIFIENQPCETLVMWHQSQK